MYVGRACPLTLPCWLSICLAVTAALMSSVYEDHKDEDGFLYITYSGENTFGSLLLDVEELLE